MSSYFAKMYFWDCYIKTFKITFILKVRKPINIKWDFSKQDSTFSIQLQHALFEYVHQNMELW